MQSILTILSCDASSTSQVLTCVLHNLINHNDLSRITSQKKQDNLLSILHTRSKSFHINKAVYSLGVFTTFNRNTLTEYMATPTIVKDNERWLMF
jgi:hypothetical protein